MVETPPADHRSAMQFTTYEQAIASEATANDLIGYVVEQLRKFNDGEDVALDFLGRKDIGAFCKALGFKRTRNWGALDLPRIAPMHPEGVQVVPEDEGVLIGPEVPPAEGRAGPE
jgi:hypothetical protein